MGVHKFAGNIDMPSISAALQPSVAEWYNDATIEIIDPDIQGGDYSRTTNSKTRSPEIMWTGNARIQAVRWPNVATSRQAAVSLREVTFHLKKNDSTMPDFISQGWRVRVTECELAPTFTHGLFVITTAVNSSYDWDVRIEATMDQGAQIN